MNPRPGWLRRLYLPNASMTPTSAVDMVNRHCWVGADVGVCQGEEKETHLFGEEGAHADDTNGA